MGKQIAVLVNCATLYLQIVPPELRKRSLQAWSAIHDDLLGTFQTVRIQIVEKLPPRRSVFTTHIGDGKQHLLTISFEPMAARTEIFVALRSTVSCPSSTVTSCF